MKIGIIGNTLLTQKGMLSIMDLGHSVDFVFGLSNPSAKVNSVDLKQKCRDMEIPFIDSEEWTDILNFDSDLIICLGDSRIIPESIIEKRRIIGNHGAILPFVQGGASLVWGRMLNSGKWGISLMEISRVVDQGKILKILEFDYDKEINMEDFCNLCDDLTIKALIDYLKNGEDNINEHDSQLHIRIPKHIDSLDCINILRFSLENKYKIYLPTRDLSDSLINKKWDKQFTETFKIANNNPYPKYQE